MACRSIDVPATPSGSWQRQRLVGQLVAELFADAPERVLAYRHTERWVQDYEPVPFRPAAGNTPVRRGGVYLITGGLGDLGLELAEHLARTAGANLILAGRSTLPPKGEWEEWLRSHGEQDRTSAILRKLERLRGGWRKRTPGFRRRHRSQAHARRRCRCAQAVWNNSWRHPRRGHLG